MSKYLSTTSDWTFDLLASYEREIARIASEKYKLDTYPNQIEVISSEQMLDAYSSIGMPIGYTHWSFGKSFIQNEKSYVRGYMGLAYEIVINSNPCISYLMEENTMTMQALVIAHAAYGHNSFFKNNYLFKTWTDAETIIDYLVFAKNYIAECEEKYGKREVELILDAAHSISDYGVDNYKRPPKLSLKKEKELQAEREEYNRLQVNDLWRTLPEKKTKKYSFKSKFRDFPEEPQENILHFIEDHAPLLEPWQREILRIVRKMAQYFYPQGQTKVMNEGWATFWHYTLINELYNEGLVHDGFMLEFFKHHTGVIYQPAFYEKYYRGFNPYNLGFEMMSDIKRICETPTDEDKKWFPDLVGSDWLTTLDFAMKNFKDESFIAQYLSPTMIRKLKLFNIKDDDNSDFSDVTDIHDEEGYKGIRTSLSNQFHRNFYRPDIQVWRTNQNSDRALILRYSCHNRRPLNYESLPKVLRYIRYLWGFPVVIDSVDDRGMIVDSTTMM